MTTKNFLRCFSMSDLSELPKLPDSEPETKQDIAEQLEVDVDADTNADNL